MGIGMEISIPSASNGKPYESFKFPEKQIILIRSIKLLYFRNNNVRLQEYERVFISFANSVQALMSFGILNTSYHINYD